MHISSSYTKILEQTMAKLRMAHASRLGQNTPGTAGGPGGRDRRLAVKSRKTSEKSPFFLKKIKFTQKKYLFFTYIF